MARATACQSLRDLSTSWDGFAVVVIGHSATKWALDCLLDGKVLDELVDAPFDWRQGWRYLLRAAPADQDST